jgi:prevent-host-death family protein
MTQLASLREFNHQVAKYVQLVERGEHLIITRYGKPVARLSPCQDEVGADVSRQQALVRSLNLIRKAKVVSGFSFNREELYDQ